jgi:hypothetical protein
MDSFKILNTMEHPQEPAQQKLLFQFEHSWQADLFVAELESIDIKPFVVAQARDYATISTGNPNTQSRIYVNQTDYIRAKMALDKFLAIGAQETASNEPAPKDHFKRVIVFSMLGFVVLPIVFNLYATLDFLALKKQKPSFTKLVFALSFLLGGWAVALYAVRFIFDLLLSFLT